MSYPTIYFRQDLFVGAELQLLLTRLHDIAKTHKGNVASKMEEADHVVYPPAIDEQMDPSQRLDYIRVVKKKRQRHSFASLVYARVARLLAQQR